MRTLNKRGLLICLVLVAGSTLLTACGNESPGSRLPYVRYEIVADGCTVKAIENPKGANFFIAKCPAESTTTTHIQQNGKSSTTIPVVTTQEVEDLEKKLADVKAKQAALSKLSPEDKKALGIK
jgi:hypothetical protein